MQARLALRAESHLRDALPPQPVNHRGCTDHHHHHAGGCESHIQRPPLPAGDVGEDVVASEDLADIGVILGTGFAPFRGGPLQARKEGSV